MAFSRTREFKEGGETDSDISRLKSQSVICIALIIFLHAPIKSLYLEFFKNFTFDQLIFEFSAVLILFYSA